MQKWEYCGIEGASFGSNSDEEITTKDPRIVYFSSNQVEVINLYPSPDEYEGKIYKTLDRLIKRLNYRFGELFNQKEIVNEKFLENRLISENLNYEQKFQKFTDFENTSWSTQYLERRIVKLFIIAILNQGWEMMDHDGIWFKRPLKE